MVRPSQTSLRRRVRPLRGTRQGPSPRCPRSLRQRLLRCRVKDVRVLRCDTGLAFSLRTGSMIRNWADSSNPPSGSIKPIRHIDALWPPAPLAITFRSPLRLRWPRWPWSLTRNMPSSPSFWLTGAKRSSSLKAAVVARGDEQSETCSGLTGKLVSWGISIPADHPLQKTC